jgi:hypothetical protein
MSEQTDPSGEEELYDDLDGTTRAVPPRIEKSSSSSFSFTSSSVVAATDVLSQYSTHHLPGRRTSKEVDEADIAPIGNSNDIALLRAKVKMLESENRILKRNIGTLFRTARNEIKRKDNQIHQLMSLSSPTHLPPQPPPPPPP